MDNFIVLLYYYYHELKDPLQIINEHKKFCSSLNLKGRIIICNEGLNGTISGPKNDCIKYMDFVKSYNQFKNIEFKIDTCTKHLFPKMSIKNKKEIVKFANTNIDMNNRGIHINGNDFLELAKDPNSVIIDVRSNYEHKLGKFKNAKTFNLSTFRDFPEKFKQDELYLNQKNRKKNILTYCTGGIKCEKASAYLKKLGFENVYQLHGGIIKHGNEFNGKDFEGACYVFDGRVVKNVNKVNPTVITNCYICKIKTSNMINCMNVICNKHTTMCEECYSKMNNCCSKECILSIKRREIPEYFSK